ncbi:MAG: hypothetical protein J6Y90_04490 [Lachnospiraceae bacterium]|nr:hypothetical protein [Lachnospiraceae bacterium]
MISRDSKIIRYRVPFRVNIGVVLFACILLYLVWNIVSLALHDKIAYFVVTDKTSMSLVDSFDALILRDERVTYSNADGYVNYYLQSGGRAASGDIICSVDEKGDYNNLLHNGLSPQQSLTGADFTQMKSALVSYGLNPDKNDYSSILDLKYGIESRLLSIMMLADDESLVYPGIDQGMLHVMNASDAGLIEYTVDGMEYYDPTTVTAEIFEHVVNKPETVVSGSFVSRGEPLFKQVVSDTWSMIIPLTSSQAERYSRSSLLNVEFPDLGISTYVRVNVFFGADGLFYANLSLSRYLPLFSDRRFTSINISESSEKGFLIPKTAIGNLDCYVIPKIFSVDKSDNYTPQFVATDPNDILKVGSTIRTRAVKITDDAYYIDPSSISAGTKIKALDSQMTFTVSETAEVEGAFCINKGYARFCPVNVLGKDDSYAIVQAGSASGIAVSDRILTVFDASLNDKILSRSG